MSEAKRLFEQGLADNPNIDPCKSGSPETEMEVPDSYDWRLVYPNCVQEPQTIPQNCSSSYIYSTLSATEDRICMKSEGSSTKIQLSAQELIDCNLATNGCTGGQVNKVLSWGKRRGFVPSSCYPLTGD